MTRRRERRAVWLAMLVVIAAAGLVRAQAETAVAPSREQELVAVLRSETPEAEKAIAFKNLAIHGSPACVEAVATYLGNERLASWARITLEAIPGGEASAALRSASETLSGRLLVGAINSLGVRRDAAAVPLLEKRLGDPDATVVVAAAAALGTIGTPAAADALSKAFAAGEPARDAVAEACVVCGEQLLAAGDETSALKLFDAVRQADVSEQRRAEATRAAILARGEEGIPLLVELLRAPSQRLFNMGLFTARQLAAGPDRDAAIAYEVDLALLKSLAGSGDSMLAAQRKPLVIDLLADRNAGAAATAVQRAILEAAASDEPALRLAAIRAIGRCGDAASADGLLGIAAGADAAIVPAIRESIATMTADGVDERLVAGLTDADPAVLPLVIGLVGDRRIGAATTKVLPLVDHGDPAVRSAALAALGSIVDLGNVEVLITKATAPRDDAEATAAATALKEAAVRMPDREACAARVAAAIAAAGPRAGVLVETLADVGGTKALAAVAMAAKSGDQSLADVSTRVLGKWMTADAAPVLLELATTDAAGPYRGRALKGYLRIARQFALPEPERAEMCRKALAAAKDPADRKAVVEILVRYPHPTTLVVAKEATALPDVADEAKAAVAMIEGKLAPPASGK